MESRNFIAHRRKCDNKDQTVQKHLIEVSLICRRLAEKVVAPDAGELLGLLHDFGKYSQQFQIYLQSATGMLNPDIDDEFVDFEALKGKIDHSSAGAQWVMEKMPTIWPSRGIGWADTRSLPGLSPQWTD